MNKDPASLENLSDIAVPPPVSWWPLAQGWWIVIGIAVIVIAVAVGNMWLRWQANAYRRAAARCTRQSENGFGHRGTPEENCSCSIPTDRCCVTVRPGLVPVAEYHDGQRGSANVAETLTRGVFDRTTAVQTDELRDFAAESIASHRVPDDEPADAVASGAVRDQGGTRTLTLAFAWVLWLVPLPLIVRRLAPPRVVTQAAVRVPFLDRLQAAGAAETGRVDKDARGFRLWLAGWSGSACWPRWLDHNTWNPRLMHDSDPRSVAAG